jgi:O-antigen ligase
MNWLNTFISSLPKKVPPLAIIALLIPVWIPGALLVTFLRLLWLFTRRKTFTAFKLHSPLLLLGIFALAYLLIQSIGLTITDDLPNGIFNLQQKLSLLLFPLLFAAESARGSIQVKNILTFFCTGTFLLSLFILLRAFYRWSNGEGSEVFHYMSLAHPLHPSYLSAYLCLALGVLFNPLSEPAKSEATYLKSFRFLLMPLGLIMLYLLQSKAGILVAMGIAVGGFTIWFIMNFRNYSRQRKTIIFLLFIVLSTATIWQLRDSRFSAMISTLKSEKQTADPSDSNELRLRIWQTGLRLFSEHWLVGYGAGDVKHVLKKAYLNQGMKYAAAHELNAHNQFLQTALGGGIMQLLFLLAYLLTPLLAGTSANRWISVVLLIILMLNMLFESYFESQWGIVFATFFMAMLATPVQSEKSNLIPTS